MLPPRGAAAIPLVALLALLAPPGADATIWTVEPDGTGDFPTIQAAVDFASDGDEIVLGDGTFTGLGNLNIDFSGKAVTIRSASGDPGSCTIDGTGAVVSGIVFRSGEGEGSVLADLTVRRAGGPCKAAILCEGSSPTIRNLVLRECRPFVIRCLDSSASFEGVLVEGNLSLAFSLLRSDVSLRDVEILGNDGSLPTRAISSSDGSPTLENVTVRGTWCPVMAFWDGTPLVSGCLVEANTRTSSRSAGTIVLTRADATIENTSIVGNGTVFSSIGYLGSGLSIHGSSPTVRDCRITGNRSAQGGGVSVSGLSNPSFERCTIAGNEARQGGGIYLRGPSPAPTVHLTRTIVWGNCATDLGPDGYLGTNTVLQVGCVNLAPASFAGPGELVPIGDVVTADPLFCEPVTCPGLPTTAGVYSLAKNSPALGHACGAIGALGQGCGATGLEPTSWGRVKSLYLSRP